MTAGLPNLNWGNEKKMSEIVREVAFDVEWFHLIRQAKELGISKEEIRKFLAGVGSEKDSTEIAK